MSDNHLDSLLVEAISKSLFNNSDIKEDEEEGEIVKEDGEIDSGNEGKGRHKKSKHKTKHKTKCKDKDIKKNKAKKKPSTKTSDKSIKSVDKKEDTERSNVMKLLLSDGLSSYAGIQFKDEPKDLSTKKSTKHKSSKSGDTNSDSKKHRKKSSKHSSDSYETQKDLYYPSKSSSKHEDYFYGSYYEGEEPRRRSDYYSRPLSPLYDSEWKHRSRSRSPIDYQSSGRSRRRSMSPYDSRSEDHDRRSEDYDRNDRRSVTPFYKDSYLYKNKNRRRSLSPDNNDRQRRGRSRGVSLEPIDKQKLYEIARNNLIKMIEKGDLPKGTNVHKLKLKHLRELTTQKSIQHWTEFCRAISTLESAISSDSEVDSDSETVGPKASEESIFTIRHPFKLKERKDIEFRVRDFNQLPSRSSKDMQIELRQQFPVSSGNNHRLKELEWRDVPEPLAIMPPPPPPKPKKVDPKPSTSTATPKGVPPPDSDDIQKAFTIIPTNKPEATPPNTIGPTLPPSAVPPVQPTVQPTVQSAADSTTTESEAKTDTRESVFQPSTLPVDIGSIMAQRLHAMRKLQEDPHNVVALKQMYQSNQMMTEWAESKIEPGQFSGSTGVNVLSPDQLNGPLNAWTRKDQLKTAAPITGGIGMHLLQKMGWNPGQGLGKNNDGTVDPIALDIKMDKKGLVAPEELVRNLPSQLVSTGDPKNAGSGCKNPVSMLYELCAKRKMKGPDYEVVSEEGPPHRKTFTFKVIMGGIEYQPSVSSGNKKQAKALAASVCLQSLGQLPKDKT